MCHDQIFCSHFLSHLKWLSCCTVEWKRRVSKLIVENIKLKSCIIMRPWRGEWNECRCCSLQRIKVEIYHHCLFYNPVLKSLHREDTRLLIDNLTFYSVYPGKIFQNIMIIILAHTYTYSNFLDNFLKRLTYLCFRARASSTISSSRVASWINSVQFLPDN